MSCKNKTYPNYPFNHSKYPGNPTNNPGNADYPAIPFADLILRPDRYTPLATTRSVNNVANEPSFDSVDMEEVFSSKSNQLLLARNLYKVSRQNGGRSGLQKFIKLVPAVQKEFCKENNLNEFDMAESGATGQKDWVLILRAVNNMFIKKCYSLLRWNMFVPFRETVTVGSLGNRKVKKMSNLLADDIPTIDLWADVDIDRTNKNFWLENKIPIWRESIQRRHYDRSNEGLAQHVPERASLENFQRGFDMSTVFATIDSWKPDAWWGPL